MTRKAALGSGARWASLHKKLAKSLGSNANIGAIEASIGRKKYGNVRFNKLAAAGRRTK